MRTAIIPATDPAPPGRPHSAEGMLLLSMEEVDDLVLALDRAVTHGHTVIEPEEVRDFKLMRETVRRLQTVMRATTVKPRRRKEKLP